VAERRSSEAWASRLGVILAVAASAVGLGNFLRFPGQAAQHGGGAFMIPYFVALLLLGIPLGWAEWTMGRYGGLRGFNSAPGIYSVIWRHPLAKYLGGVALLVPLVICMYYVVIEAWCLGYAWFYLTGELMQGEKEPGRYAKFFDSFIGSHKDGFLYEGGHGRVIWFIGITFIVNFVLIYRGINRGIEAFCKWAMPIMAVCALCVLVRVVTLGTPNPAQPEQNLVSGLGYMWNPKFAALLEPKTWLAAAGQIFFTLGVGFGIIINYSSYLKRSDDVVLSGLTASSVNEFFEVCLGGLITIPAAFMFLGMAGLKETGTYDLGFKTLPHVFAAMPGGQLFGFLWFTMLFLAAITSSISMLQPVIAFFEEGLGLKRHASVAFLFLISAMGSAFVVYFSKNRVALDTLDFWGGTMLLAVLALVQAVLYGWVLGIDAGERAAHEGAHLRIPQFVQYIIKYVSPTFLLLVLGGVFVTDGPSYLQTLKAQPAAGMAFGLIALLLVFFTVLIHIAGRRWEAEGRLKQP
jgi:NSS family neurotransmitter:Na+ symporter